MLRTPGAWPAWGEEWAVSQASYVCQVNYVLKGESISQLVMSDSSQPHGLYPVRLLCPWDFPDKNTGVNSHSLLQGIFLTQGLSPGVLHCRQILYYLSHQGRPSKWLHPTRCTSKSVQQVQKCQAAGLGSEPDSAVRPQAIVLAGIDLGPEDNGG